MLVFYIASSLLQEHSDENTLNYPVYISSCLSMSISTSISICRVSYWPECLYLVSALPGESPLKIYIFFPFVVCFVLSCLYLLLLVSTLAKKKISIQL